MHSGCGHVPAAAEVLVSTSDLCQRGAAVVAPVPCLALQGLAGHGISPGIIRSSAVCSGMLPVQRLSGESCSACHDCKMHTRIESPER